MFETVIELEHEGKRLDVYCSELVEHSRAKVVDMIKQSKILINGKPVKPSYQIKVDDVLTMEAYEPTQMALTPTPMALDIVYEDDQLIVINKPKGLIVHPGAGATAPTLVEGLLAHTSQLSQANHVTRPGIVHRLDKDTSGLMVVAKNDVAHAFLANQLKDHTMKRTYWVLVHKAFNHLRAKVDAPIGRDPKNRVKMTVIEQNSKPAVSHFTKLENLGNYTLLQCQLETGRTHQIRVHCEYMGYPVVNDPLYNPLDKGDENGQCLAAVEIEFIHPVSKQKMTFKVEPDAFFLKTLQRLRGELNE